MYKSFFILLNDYFLTVRKNAIFDILLPFIIAIFCGYLISKNLLDINKSFLSTILNVLGIIAGFSITSVSLLATSNNKNIKELKNKKTKITVDGLEISAFRRFYILISYSVFISFIAILINVIGYLVPWSNLIPSNFIVVLKSINLWLIFHIFFLNIRNITSLYFVYFQETND